ncbi:hypothetical protein [Jeotgalibacillus sp. S-D1]|nr:hypothetical protein [Jeotgalibacillus sp. S-D1]
MSRRMGDIVLFVFGIMTLIVLVFLIAVFLFRGSLMDLVMALF